MTPSTRRCILSATLVGSTLTSLLAPARAEEPAALISASSLATLRDRLERPTTLAVYGDAPYGTTPTDTEQFDATPAFIDSINADPDVDLVIHVGDIHSGKQYCTEAYDRSIYSLWTQFRDPLVYTPGDNEWSDCHKKAQGGGAYKGDPVANLDLLRSIFFARPGTTLGRRKLVLSQGLIFDPGHRSDAKYVENVIWTQSGVVFATVNVPGGSNNDQDVWYGAPTETSRQLTERTERTGAALRWLDFTFGAARLLRAKGVVLVLQADMWDPEKGAEHQVGYASIVDTVARRTQSFRGPVLMLNGDSHEYLSDNPLAAADPLNYMHPGYDVANFHRIVVHGSTLPLEWLRLTVDPNSNDPEGDFAFGPFSWQREGEPAQP
jgi:hypothetical protein